MMWLKSLTDCPPQEFFYEQTEGIYRRFPQTPLIKELASSVSDFRKGNKLPRPSFGEALEDIVVYTVKRLNGNPQWCFETDLNAGALLPQQGGGGCSGCGASVS